MTHNFPKSTLRVLLLCPLMLSIACCRRPAPTTFIVAPSPTYNEVRPVYEIGQVLVWEGVKDSSAFEIDWTSGNPPCEGGSSFTKSVLKDKVQTATCRLTKLPDAGHPFSYLICQPGMGQGCFSEKGPIHPLDQGPGPCDGCLPLHNPIDYQPDAADHTPAVAGPKSSLASQIDYTCSNNIVTTYPPVDPLPHYPEPLTLNFNQTSNNVSVTAIKFTLPAGVQQDQNVNLPKVKLTNLGDARVLVQYSITVTGCTNPSNAGMFTGTGMFYWPGKPAGVKPPQ